MAVKKRVLIGVGILAFACVPLAAQGRGLDPKPQAAAGGRDAVAAEFIKGLEASLPAWIKQGDVPGVAVAVVDGQRVLWQGVYGFTSRVKDKPVTPRTLFSIQSMSKSFTALG